ncbi:MAG: phasin family protein [Thauera sp.]|nr:phasin family protein [Thauera sp.]
MNTHPAFQQFAHSTRNGFEQFQAYALIALDASEKLCALNFGAARTLCEAASAAPLAQAGADLEESFAKQRETQGQTLEQLGSYLQQVNEVVSGAQSEMLELGSRHFEDFQASMQSMMEEARKLGSVEAFQSAVAEPRSRTMRKAA